MGKPKGVQKTGGRKPGVPNKKTQALIDICFEEGLDVWRAMVRLAKEGEEGIKLSMLKELAQYLYPKRKAVEHSLGANLKRTVKKLDGTEIVYSNGDDDE